MINEIKLKFNEGYSLIDLCEKIFMRKIEILHCLSIINHI